MKRDINLVRKILLRLEAHSEDSHQIPLEFEGYSEAEVQYNLGLMWKASLIEAIDVSTMDGNCYLPKRLTWEGHDFLDAARDDGRWKNFVMEYGQIPLDLAKEYLKQQLREHLGLGLAS